MRPPPDCHVLSLSEAVHGPFECWRNWMRIRVKVFYLFAGILALAAILSSASCANQSEQAKPYRYRPSAIIPPSPSPEPGHIPMGGFGSSAAWKLMTPSNCPAQNK